MRVSEFFVGWGKLAKSGLIDWNRPELFSAILFRGAALMKRCYRLAPIVSKVGCAALLAGCRLAVLSIHGPQIFEEGGGAQFAFGDLTGTARALLAEPAEI